MFSAASDFDRDQRPVDAVRKAAAPLQAVTDLDAATRHQLDRGRRLMELMKQDVHVTLPVAKQVAMIYAGTHGYLDAVPVAKLKTFEAALFEVLDREPADYLKRIAASKAMTPEVVEALEAVLKRLSVRA